MYEDQELMELDGLLEDLEDPEAYESSWESLGEDSLEGSMFEDEDQELWEDEDMEWSGLGEEEDLEGDMFVGSLIRKAKGAIKKVAGGPFGGVLKGLAKQAARVAGGAIGGPAGAKIASAIANKVIRESDFEDEDQYEGDPESDLEVMGGDPEIYEEMEYLASLAAESDNEEEADQFIGAIASLAGPLISSLVGGDGEDGETYEDMEYYEDEADQFLPLIPLAASLLPKAIPLVSKGIKAIGKAISGSKSSRKMVRALPRVAAKTATGLARQMKTGRPLTKKTVAATMARQTAKALAKPKTLAKTIRKNKAVARRRVFTKGPAVKRVQRTAAGTPLRTPPVRVRPALVRKAVGPIPAGSMPVSGGPGYAPDFGPNYGPARRRRVIRPRYCVY